LISAGSAGPEGQGPKACFGPAQHKSFSCPGRRKFGTPAGELTQVDASGCESGDNGAGGKGNQTAPHFRPGRRRPADGISNTEATAAAADAVNGSEIS